MMPEFLLRSTVLLSVGTILLLVLQRYLPIRSAKVQRLAWFAVLLQGVLFCGVAWEIPVEPLASELPLASGLAPSGIAVDFISDEPGVDFISSDPGVELISYEPIVELTPPPFSIELTPISPSVEFIPLPPEVESTPLQRGASPAANGGGTPGTRGDSDFCDRKHRPGVGAVAVSVRFDGAA